MNDEYISFSAGVIEERYLWCINNCDGGLYCIDRQNYKIELLASVIDCINEEWPYIKAILYKNKIYFFPLYSDENIIVYNINMKKIEKIPLTKSEKKIRYSMVSINKSQILFLPRSSTDEIVYFDMDSNKIFHSLYTKLGYHINTVVVNDKVWIPIYNSNKLVEFNAQTGVSKIHYIKGYKLGGAVAFDGELYWLSVANYCKVISWDPKADKVTVYESQNSINEIGEYATIICINNKIFLFPVFGENIKIIDKESRRIINAFEMPEDFHLLPHRWGPSFLEYSLIEDEIWVYPAMGNELLIIDTVSLTIHGVKLLVPSLSLLYKKYFIDRSIIYSENDISLIEYNRLLASSNSIDNCNKSLKSMDYGNIIYRYIKNYK